MEIQSGIKWFMIFIDECIRMTWLYIMKNKSEVFGVFCFFYEMVKTQFSTKIQILRTYNNGENSSNEFHKYFKVHGIIHETTYPQTPYDIQIPMQQGMYGDISRVGQFIQGAEDVSGWGASVGFGHGEWQRFLGVMQRPDLA